MADNVEKKCGVKSAGSGFQDVRLPRCQVYFFVSSFKEISRWAGSNSP